MSNNKNYEMITKCLFIDALSLFSEYKCEHPLDNEIQEKLKSLQIQLKDRPKDYEIFHDVKLLDSDNKIIFDPSDSKSLSAPPDAKLWQKGDFTLDLLA